MKERKETVATLEILDVRKLQENKGGKDSSSFFISLPRDWVNRKNLKKGSFIKISEADDGSLILKPTEE